MCRKSLSYLFHIQCLFIYIIVIFIQFSFPLFCRKEVKFLLYPFITVFIQSLEDAEIRAACVRSGCLVLNYMSSKVCDCFLCARSSKNLIHFCYKRISTGNKVVFSSMIYKMVQYIDLFVFLAPYKNMILRL